MTWFAKVVGCLTATTRNPPSSTGGQDNPTTVIILRMEKTVSRFILTVIGTTCGVRHTFLVTTRLQYVKLSKFSKGNENQRRISYEHTNRLTSTHICTHAHLALTTTGCKI